jgi:hypothetical protein
VPENALDWPVFDAPLLAGIATAFLHRRKALRYDGILQCERDFSELPNRVFERLNIDYRNGIQLRLSVWEDGQIWFRACIPRRGRDGGWAFLHHFHGVVNGVPGEEITQLFEESCLLYYWKETENDRAVRLRALWRRVSPRDVL